MATTDVQALFLQVDASIELLRKSMAEGEQPLDRFEKRAQRMADNVDRSIGQMGGRFGEFAKLAQTAAQRAERAFEDSFDEIQRLAARAVSAPIQPDGRVSIGAADARAAADQAQRQAAATRALAEAAERAARGEGELTRETQLYLSAARAAVIEADRNASALAREAGAIEQIEIELNQASAAQQAFTVRGRDIASQTTQQRVAMQQLGFQVNDVATQYALGTPAMQIWASQGGQVIQILQQMDSNGNRVLAFLASFQGTLVSVALIALTPFIAKLFEESEASKEAKKATEDHTRAVEAQREALERAVQTTEDKLNRDYRLAEAQRRIALDTRAATKAMLEQAKAEAEAAASPAGQALAGEAGFAAVAATRARVAELNTQLAANDAEIRNAEQAAARAGAVLIKNIVDAQSTPEGRVRRKYEDLAGEAEKELERSRRSQSDYARYAQTLARLNAAREAEEKLLRNSRSSTSSNREIGRQITIAEAREIVEDIGGRVTSGQRSREKQEELYARYKAGLGPLAAAPGSSYHERGQAVDIAKGPGISLGSIRKAFAAKGVRLVELLDEGSHFHAAFGRKGASPAALEQRVARAQETLRQREISEDISFTAEERQARRRLLEATRRSAVSEEAREQLLRDDAEVEAASYVTRINLLQSAGKLDVAQATWLLGLNEAARNQKLQNIELDRAGRVLNQRFDAQEAGLEAEIAALRIEQDLEPTRQGRRRVAADLLAAEQELRRLALKRISEDPQSTPAQVQQALTDLKGLPRVEEGERRLLDEREQGPLGQYRDEVARASADINESLESVAVQGFRALEDAGSRATAQAVTDLLGLKGVAADVIGGVISDLARLAIQKAIVSAVGGGFFGLAEGGAIADLPGFAGGGSPGGLIQGPGTGKSDSILAVLANGKGAIRVSTGEFIMNEDATRAHLPMLRAMNAGRPPRFADGGLVGGAPVPTLRAPRLPALATSSGNRPGVAVPVNIKIDATGADPAGLARVEASVNKLRRDLPATVVSTVADARSRGILPR